MSPERQHFRRGSPAHHHQAHRPREENPVASLDVRPRDPPDYDRVFHVPSLKIREGTDNLRRMCAARNRWTGLALTLALAGCSDAFGTSCTEETKIIEVDYGSWAEKYQREQVDKAIADGWECVGESIRNAFGGRIGSKYTCTRCT